MEYYTALKRLGSLYIRPLPSIPLSKSCMKQNNKASWNLGLPISAWSFPKSWFIQTKFSDPLMFESKIASLSGLCLNTDNPPTLG